ncbi:uncharacterized protein LOC110979311 [Acanthaster planci]|uniref:Uncharacterized protein LOC110979311 n=1 Tax=Acanthaster planci TaxID=133434 RepID=A0A8B7YGC3_ACAPL|nr:uncharacterized protein LOC110979311 [Acanthaster planci]
MSRASSVCPLVTDESPPPPYVTKNTPTNAYEMTHTNGSVVGILVRSKTGDHDTDVTGIDARHHVVQNDDDDSDIHLTYYEAMSPLFKFMQFMGLWHAEVIKPPKAKSKSRKILNSRNYSIVVLIFLWINLVRFLPAFFVGAELDPSRLYFKVIYMTVLLQAALNASVNFWAASRTKMLRQYFFHFEKYIQQDAENKLDLGWLRRRSKAFAAVAILYVCCHFLNQVVGVFGPVESIRNSTNIFVAPFYPHIGLHVVCIYLNIYAFASWIFPLLYFLLTCQLMSRLFQDFDERIEKETKRATAEKIFPPNFEKLRRQHQHLCESVSLANSGLFTYINLITYLTMGPLACFMLYQLLFSQGIAGNISAYLMYGIWLSSIFINVCVVSWYAAVMSSKAHDPRDDCYVCVVKDVSNEQLMQMNLFLSRLNGEDIGFTIFDLVTITKPFILTLGGLVLTYYAIISEFQG